MFKRSFKVLAFAALFWCCCFLSISQTQNTYLLGLTNDHYSTIESTMTPGNFVHVGTVANSTTSGTHDIHAMEVDGAGNIVWEWIYQTAQDERAFHVDESPNGYIISGYVINNDDQPCHVLLLEIGFFGGILQQASYQDNFLGQHSSGLHVRSVSGDPAGGFIVAGLATTGLQDANSKAGMLLKVDAGLNAQWVRYYESPNGFNDHDMGSHVLEVPNKGYFMSGSCNAANGDQHVYGAMTDYTGTLLWDTEYADNNGNGHTSVAASAIYDAQTDQVIQLCNLSIIHHWGITTYDVSTGVRDLNRSFRVFSNLGYANIQGFKLLQAPNPDHLIIAGYMRDHSWPEVDDAGNPTGNMLTGSPPFICEVDKQGSTFLWDNMYLVPSPGYTMSSDIFGAFSAGQQPRILHPEMALRKSDGLGYWMNAYNNSGSGQFDIEIIELDLVGANPCSAAPLDFTFASSQWFDENNVDEIAGSVPTFITGLQAMPITPQLVSCANTPCIPDATFSITELGDCCYQFDDLSPLPVGTSCPQTWDIIDLSTGAHLCTGTGSSISCCFPVDGTYNICYEDCCVDVEGNVVTTVHCEDLVVDCSDCEVPVFDWNWWASSADLCPNGGCSIGFNCPIAPDGSLLDPDKYCMTWDFGDGTVIAGDLGFCPIHCYADCGIYSACATVYCCEDDSQVLTVCHEVEVDCCCEVPVFDWSWVASSADLCPNGGCAIGFDCPTTSDGTILNSDEYCVIWDFGDGTVVNGDLGVCPIHCYADCGIYSACATVYCCEDDSQFLTVCHEVEVDCCCEVPVFDWSWVSGWDGSADLCPNGGCTIGFNCPTALDGSLLDPDKYCMTWDFGDGTIIAGDLDVCPIHCYADCGIYNACATVYCCEDDSQVLTVCHEVVVDCCCEVPDFDWNWVVSGADICTNGGCAIGFDCPTTSDGAILDSDEYCVIWDFGDGTVINGGLGVCPIHCYADCGIYNACATVYCCEDDSQFLTVCHEVVVDCCDPCALPTEIDFSWGPSSGCDDCLDGCCVSFDSGVIWPEDGLCVVWDFGDGSAPHTALNDFNIFHCFPGSGTYTVCYTVYCCEDDSQAITVCHEVTVDCGGCDVNEIQPSLDIQQDGCVWTFTVLDLSGNDPDHLCVSGEPFGGAIVPLSQAIWTVDFTGQCTGWGYCFEIFCCNDPTGAGVGICFDGIVDCCCDASFDVTQDECCVTLTGSDSGVCLDPAGLPSVDLNGDGVINILDTSIAIANGCCSYDMGDGTVYNGPGPFTHCYAQSGTYTICHTVCCVLPDGSVQIEEKCEDINVLCPQCVLPTGLDFGWGPTANPLCTDGCSIGFDCPVLDADLYCVHWDFGDGNTYDVANSCPIHCYDVCGIYTVCLTIYCCEDDTQSVTICHEVQVDCCSPCDLDPVFVIDLMSDCCYAFSDQTPTTDPNGNDCDYWEIIDASGVTIANAFGDFWQYCFQTSGSYVVCHTDCCLNADGTQETQTYCQDIFVDCGCPEPDVTNIIAVSDDNCEWGFCAEGDFGSNVHCAIWDWGDGVVENHPLDVCPIHHYTCDGIYNVCVTVYCCEDESVSDTYCIEIEVDCPCTLPQVDFEVGADECTVFTDVINFTDDPCPEGVCYEWDFGDGSVPVSGNPGATHTYSGSGVYVVCLTVYCCDEPALGYSFCKEVEVDCGCPEPDVTNIIAVSDDNCEWGFCAEGDFGSNVHCAIWDWGDGVVENHPLDVCPIHHYTCDGIYNVCVTVYCCEDESVSDTYCIEIEVDCPCELPQGDFSINTDGCMITADAFLLTPALCIEDYCVSWNWGDGSPTTSGFWGMHTYDADGTYTICMTVYCCEDSSISYTVCHTVTVDCPCTQPELFEIQVVISDDCELGFCAIGDFDFDEHCVTWSWGDGNVEDHPLDFCPLHQYTCDGDYEVCATVYCCDDPTISTTVCIDLTVDCPCHLPTQADLIIGVTDCDIDACVLQAVSECPDDYCYTWDFGDGTSVANGGPCEPHSYASSGTYTVCVSIFCCDEPNLPGLVLCQEVAVNCCDLGTPDFDIDIDDCTACFSPTIDGLPVGSDICYDFHFMWNVDGSVGTADPNPCYTYPESGNYTVCMHIWCCDDLDNIMLICKDITVDCPCDLPSGVDFGIDQNDCTVDVGAITTDDYNGELCFEWDFGDGSTSVSGETASHTYSESGHYTICLTVFCCDDPNVSITVCHEVCVICPCTLPQVDIVYDIVNCTAYFSVAGLTDDVAGVCYDWDFGDGTGGSGTNVNHTYAASGTYTVCLTVYCCNDLTTAYTICLQVTVECPACNLPSGAGIDCSVNDCTVAFGAFYTDDYSGSLCFIWDFGDGTPPALSEVAAHTYFASGTYTVCLYIHCCNDPSEVMTVCKEVTVECDGQCPEPCELHPAYAYIQNPFTFADGCCVNFTDLSKAGGSTTITGWSWDFGDGTISNLQHPTHCYLEPGVHTVCLTITGTSPDGDCTATFCWEVQCGAEDTCPGDLDHDGDTDTADLLLLLISFGEDCE